MASKAMDEDPRLVRTRLWLAGYYSRRPRATNKRLDTAQADLEEVVERLRGPYPPVADRRPRLTLIPGGRKD